MYALNAAYPNSPYSTKSTLQALLKTRRQLLNNREKSTANNNEEKLMQDLSSIGNEDILHFSTNGTTTQEDTYSSLKDVDPNGDFTYSQKLFHIADGNLYSIFSPLQGRSYGMKPSFLRKQKCTVRECRGRGRKVLRKGLKFHNFLPSESVTSEKGTALLDDQWKIHSECKLREEHGTKQITVSNWFHSVKQPVEEENKSRETAQQDLFYPRNVLPGENINEKEFSCEESTEVLTKSRGETACSPAVAESLPLPNPTIFKYPSLPPVRSPTKTNIGKSNFLNNLLLSVASSKVTEVTSSPKTDLSAHQRLLDCDGQKRRRKPEQTRRVVPYKKYLSLMEETETGPLDLSLPSNNPSSQVSAVNSFHENYEQSNNFLRHFNNHVTPSPPPFPSTYKKPAQYSVVHNQESQSERGRQEQQGTNSSNHRQVAQPCYSNTSGSYYPLPFKENSRIVLPSLTMPSASVLESPKQNYYASNSQTHSSFRSDTRKEPVFKYGPSIVPQPNGADGAKYCENSKYVTIKPRKKSQRSVIKQKLEDTFKQNGFLVKTKQVSDGEATFCKFRQLRKYTRYYLKSWQQHLPEEVHKMWKGFLPPKTVLPPISGIISSTSNET